MDGLQLLEEISNINKRLKLISFIIEKPIYKNTLKEEDLQHEACDFMNSVDKIKEQITNIEFIKI
jgi:hypothetical protein